MNVLKINTTPKFQIVPRENLDVSRVLKLEIKSEFSQSLQEINATVELLENENYLLTLESFPSGSQDEKFSYTIFDLLTNNIVSLGKFLIVAENADIQNYSNKETNIFYS